MGKFGAMKIKNQIILSNKESFSDLVENMIGNQKHMSQKITNNHVQVLMIAEKPSIAKSLSDCLCGGKAKMGKMGRLSFFKFENYFKGVSATITVSSVAGHVYGADFISEHNKWDAIETSRLYDVSIEKKESDFKGKLPGKLASLAKGKDIICLWLDCDKEGENICYEVLYNTFPFMTPRNYQQIYRAKFSSLTKEDLKKAYNNLNDIPNLLDSLFVDARQVNIYIYILIKFIYNFY